MQQIFADENGTFTVPSGITSITIEGWGYGGAGAEGDFLQTGSGGGGAGYFRVPNLAVSETQEFAVTFSATYTSVFSPSSDEIRAYNGNDGYLWEEPGAGGSWEQIGTAFTGASGANGGGGGQGQETGDGIGGGGGEAGGYDSINNVYITGAQGDSGGAGGAGSETANNNGGRGGNGGGGIGPPERGLQPGGGGGGGFTSAGFIGGWRLVIFTYSTKPTYTHNDKYLSTDTWVVPAGVSSVFVECTGGGGSGENNGGQILPSSGGGGGGYAADTVSVTAGNTFYITLTPPTVPSSTPYNGSDAVVEYTTGNTVAYATGGAYSADPAFGGQRGDGTIGDLLYHGGDGGIAEGKDFDSGGGGGEAGSWDGHGAAGGAGGVGVGGIGGNSGGEGGDGGDGGTFGVSGNSGETPGGGGGGNGKEDATGLDVGAGGAPVVWLRYNDTGGGSMTRSFTGGVAMAGSWCF